MALFTNRQRWIMDQVAKGVVRNDFGETWSIMRKHAHGQQRAPSAKETNSLLSGKFVELVTDENGSKRVKLTGHGEWALRADDASNQGTI